MPLENPLIHNRPRENVLKAILESNNSEYHSALRYNDVSRIVRPPYSEVVISLRDVDLKSACDVDAYFLMGNIVGSKQLPTSDTCDRSMLRRGV